MDENDEQIRSIYSSVRIIILIIAFLLFLPVIVHTGAIGPLIILLGYWSVKSLSDAQKRKILETHSVAEPNAIIIQELPNGKWTAFDYETLDRLTRKEYPTANSARIRMLLIYPGINIQIL